MRVLYVIAALVIGCGPGATGDDDDDTYGPVIDADDDSITDEDEAAPSRDTDGDGTPDYQDTDSDGDTLSDQLEAGDTDPDTDPVDSDSDGMPDFVDLDSDDNGRGDKVDGDGDVDSDNRPDFADLDDDNDSIHDIDELGPTPLVPTDTDNDGTPDFHDFDSDDDTIDDQHETGFDYDNDGSANYIDLDSDGDCISDQAEARGAPPADNDGDNRYDFLDRDSDNDGVLDRTEDANCSGSIDAGESSPLAGDSDGDGVSDLVEVAAGTNPTDPLSNPQANGDFVFIVPYEMPQTPASSDLDFATSLQAVDLYVILDRSGSMSAEISSVKNNLASVVSTSACPPLGTGTPGDCIPDLWAGAATVGYQGAGAAAFQNWVDIRPSPDFSSVPIDEPSSFGSAEPLTFAAYAAITGQGGGAYGMTSVLSRSSCGGSPAALAGYATFGYPCFRQGALPVVLLATDEQPISAGDTYKSPAWSTVKGLYQTAKARLIGILGSGYGLNTDVDLKQMANDTGAVDAANGNAPLVFDGAGAAAADAIKTGIMRLANGLPLDLNAVSVDDPSDAVDAVSSFVSHLETLQLGTPQCANMLEDIDTNGDAHDDKFLHVRTGTPVCWRVVSKQNTTVMPTDAPQLFRATVSVYGDGVTQLDQRDVFFLVPPENPDGPIF